MARKVFWFLLVVGISLVGLIGCKQQERERYEWEGHIFEDMLVLFEAQTPMFEEIADVFSTNDRFWLEFRQSEYHSAANLFSPYDEEKMGVFGSEEQEIITAFFMQTRPYVISVRTEYVSIHYINEDKTGGFSFIYYYGDDVDYWITVYKSRHPNLFALGDNWFTYPPKESETN